MANPAVILAAGLGSRLASEDDQFSKPLMQLDGHTLLERTVSSCRKAGVDRILVVTGFRAELVEREIARIDRGDLEAVYNPDWQRSNGLSLLACQGRLSEPFALMMADHLFDHEILANLVAAPMQPDSVTLAVDYKVSSIFDLDDATKVRVEDERIVAIGKQLDDYNAIDCGLFRCTPAIFDALEKARVAGGGDCSLSQGMQRIGDRGGFVPFDIGDSWWQDVDTPDMLAQALAVLAERKRTA